LSIWNLFYTFAVVKSSKNNFSMENQIRHMKLHGKYRRRTNRPNHVPWLNVNGLWLERAGFGVGQSVEIQIENRKLTIIAL